MLREAKIKYAVHDVEYFEKGSGRLIMDFLYASPLA